MKETLEINLAAICRICLKESPELVAISQKVTTYLNEQTPIVRMLQVCLPCPTSVDDNRFPQHLCPQCLAQCTTAFDFRQQSEESYVKLLRILDQQVCVEKTLPSSHSVEIEELTISSQEIDDEKSVDCTENPISIENEDDLSVKTRDEDDIEPQEDIEPPDRAEGDASTLPRPNTNSEKRSCPHCPARFKRSSHLARHLLIHTGLRLYRCNSCGKTFSRRDHLQTHIQNVHTEKQFKCIHCERIYAKQCLLDVHVKKKHTADPKASKIHECACCGKQFSTKTYLAKHELSHLGLVCKRCNEMFKDADALKSHEDAQSCLPRGHLCFMCGESFTRGDYLRIHMRRHTGEKPYQCQYCDKKFPRTSDLKMHERYHTDTKPNVCTLCGKSFHRAYNLKIHMRIHTGERPYKCNECDKSFTQSNDLKTHLRRHTGERYRCNVCDASFLQLFALRNHCLTTHDIQIEAKASRLQNIGQFASEPTIEMFTKCPEATKQVA